MKAKIFINYRRVQSSKEAQHLTTILSCDFNVFIDVRTVKGFSDWFQTLLEHIERTDAMIVLIDRDWLAALDRQEHPTGQTTADHVRSEIVKALRRNIPVLPVLLDGATLPREEQLPQEMRGTLRLQSMVLRNDYFPEDAAEISKHLKLVISETHRNRGIPVWTAVSLLVAALASGIAIGPYALNQAGVSRLGPWPIPEPQLDQVQKCVADVHEWLLNKERFIPEIMIALTGGGAFVSELLRQKFYHGSNHSAPLYVLYELPPGSSDKKYDDYGTRFVASSSGWQYFVPHVMRDREEKHKRVAIFADYSHSGNTVTDMRECVYQMGFKEIRTAVMEANTTLLSSKSHLDYVCSYVTDVPGAKRFWYQEHSRERRQTLSEKLPGNCTPDPGKKFDQP